jgi:PAS domain-containing protein
MPQQPIELILTRQWASYLAVPVWVVGEDGDLVYYNEPAEAVLGRRFDEAGQMPGEELATIFQTTLEDGSPVPSELLPINVALLERRPAHLRVRIRGLDGVWRVVEGTAFPIEGQGGRHLGAVAIFWETEIP